ncbi:MAG: calcium-translocating P-type ATPase, PMCA-type [Alistipes sp.]|nr:calcium-translocating P-type ATPase, PMCA-type [Alistipes sp.]
MIPYHPNGLSVQEVEESRARHGANVLTPAKDNSAWELLLDKFRDPIIRILLFAAALSLIIGIIEHDLTESIGIISAIILATFVGFWFEWDAQRRFRRLNSVNDDVPVKVMRDGQMCEIPRREVVVGDLVCIESGETIPADGVLVEAVSLRINESTLTGEPETEKSADPTQFDPEATYPTNHALRGTTVTDGYGRMVITAVGDQSEAGRVTEQATVESGEQTPLNRQLERLSQLIGKIGIGLAAAIFIILLLKALFAEALLAQGWLTIVEQILDLFMLSVAIIVMAVPEGLPMSITLSLAMSMRRMLRTNNLVRKMHACETMGAVTVICTDKTGTLTQNRMHVAEMIRYGAITDEALAESIALNSTAFLDGEGRVLGSSTEGALLQWMQQQGFDYARLRDTATILSRQTFSTHTKYMATVIRSGRDAQQLLCVKGAPEIVLAMCKNSAHLQEVQQRLLGFQQRGMRTLAIAYAPTEEQEVAEAIAHSTLQLAAIVAIADPVREDVPPAVHACLDAGIRIKIVTGDTAATATEIARQIGLWEEGVDHDGCRMTGPEFAAASDEELLERIDELKILSRARPLDKQRLVQLLQRKGEVVAVTGDGTNDAPALNFANVGLSMGSGTSVAKEASDITLLDDSFASIATAVMWGRSLYRNIQRFVLFQLTINFVAIVICLVSAIAGSEMPLTVVQILWVNIIMDTFAAMAMASLPPSREVMLDRPRPHNEFIVNRSMWRMILGCGTAMIVVLLGMLFAWGEPTLYQLTLFFSTFIFLQFWNMFNAKRFEARHSAFTQLQGCREFFAILALIFLGQLLIVEFGGEIFRCTPLAWSDWLRIIGFTSLLAIGGDIILTLTNRRKE